MFPSTEHYRNLSSEAVETLHAALLIDSTAACELAVALGTDIADTRRRLTTLAATGWMEHGEDGDMRWRHPAVLWLGHGAADHADGPAVAARYLRHHLAALTHPDRDHAAAWLAAHRGTLLAAIGAGIRTGLAEQVIATATAAWTFAGPSDDEAWHNMLAAAGEPAARNERERLDLIRHSADHLLRAGDLETAEHQYCQAIELARGLGDHEAAAEALTALAQVLRVRDQLPRAADVLLELADLRQHTGDALALATTLTELGEIMLAGDRPALACAHLTDAIGILGRIPGSPTDPPAHVHELHGHALWALGNTVRARKAFRRAIACLDGSDTEARARMDFLIRRKTRRPGQPDAHQGATRR